jgi:hypothetical protein
MNGSKITPPMSNHQPNSVLKGILLFMGMYVATLVGTAVASLLVMLVLDPQRCSDYGDALLVLWALMALLFTGSTAVVGVWAWKTITNLGGRLGVVVGYALLMLATFAICALGLLVGFNC